MNPFCLSSTISFLLTGRYRSKSTMNPTIRSLSFDTHSKRDVDTSNKNNSADDVFMMSGGFALVHTSSENLSLDREDPLRSFSSVSDGDTMEDVGRMPSFDDEEESGTGEKGEKGEDESDDEDEITDMGVVLPLKSTSSSSFSSSVGKDSDKVKGKGKEEMMTEKASMCGRVYETEDDQSGEYCGADDLDSPYQPLEEGIDISL